MNDNDMSLLNIWKHFMIPSNKAVLSPFFVKAGAVVKALLEVTRPSKSAISRCVIIDRAMIYIVAVYVDCTKLDGDVMRFAATKQSVMCEAEH